MAKKKPSKATEGPSVSPQDEAPSREGTSVKLDAQTARTLGSPVAAVVQLTNLFQVESQIRRSVNAFTSVDEVDLSASVGEPEVGHDEPITRFSVKLQFTVTATRKDSPENEEPALEVRTSYVVLYRLPNNEGITRENLIGFAMTSGVFSVWPYVREFVHTSTLRMSVPAIVLPTYRM